MANAGVYHAPWVADFDSADGSRVARRGSVVRQPVLWFLT
jgi:hypothetical protein